MSTSTTACSLRWTPLWAWSLEVTLDVVLNEILRTGTQPAQKKNLSDASRCACCTGGCSGRGPGRGHPALRRWAERVCRVDRLPRRPLDRAAEPVARQCEEWTEESITKAPTQVVLSERRGGIGLALLSGPGGLLVTCQQTLGGSGEPSGGSSETYLTDIPARDEILSDGGSGFSEDDGEPIYRHVSGRVGADVTGVVVHTAEQGDVIASVEGGYFTAVARTCGECKSLPRGLCGWTSRSRRNCGMGRHGI